jgi:ribosomal protein S10
MFINIKVLSKNQNSLKKFLILFKKFCIKKKRKENLYLVKKKLTKTIVKTNKSEIFLPLAYKLKTHTHKNVYKIKKKKCFIKKKINGIFSYFQQKQKQKVFTTLKSPHVNKTAQEQIEYRLFSKQINIFSFQILKFLILIKQIQTKICSDVEIQIKFVLNNKIILKTKLISLNPDNYKIQHPFSQKKKDIFYKQKIYNYNKEQTIFYLKLFDMYGELNFNNLFG